ncbi:MAG: hypothetical protein HOO91_18895 [Bacteroidales bacterium]|nr:hypothetical protein [Bacteroidales bacterium]
MKQITIFSFVVLMVLSSISCNVQGGKKESTQRSISAKVEVYYFHLARRCKTCLSVEETARKAVEVLYPEMVKTGEYVFKAINLDESENKVFAEELGIGGQTLLVVSGKNRLDITDKGFLNAHDLEKMKEEIQKAVDQALKG